MRVCLFRENTKNEMSSNVQEATESYPSCKILFFLGLSTQVAGIH